MFDNLLYQHASKLLSDDITHSSVPSALLLSGPSFSGKLTCALELARVLSCTKAPKGDWSCECPSCLMNKALVNPDIVICGPRDCTLEIAAAKDAFLNAVQNNEPYIDAVHYLFIRSIRKLTLRFSQVLWEDDEKISKIAAVTSLIDELLEEIDCDRAVPSLEQLTKICTELVSLCSKLESAFMYDSIPIAQIRRISSWARLTSTSQKKVVIIENADQMQETSRNALLKILEEPPENIVFILTTTRRGAVMPTILSRVRTYAFIERNTLQQKKVVERVFHSKDFSGNSIASFLQNYLTVQPEKLRNIAETFLKSIESQEYINIEKLVKDAGGFEPRLLLKLFFNNILSIWHSKNVGMVNPQITERISKGTAIIRKCYSNITTFNQTPVAALEQLYIDLKQ